MFVALMRYALELFCTNLKFWHSSRAPGANLYYMSCLFILTDFASGTVGPYAPRALVALRPAGQYLTR